MVYFMQKILHLIVMSTLKINYCYLFEIKEIRKKYLIHIKCKISNNKLQTTKL